MIMFMILIIIIALCFGDQPDVDRLRERFEGNLKAGGAARAAAAVRLRGDAILAVNLGRIGCGVDAVGQIAVALKLLGNREHK